MENKLTWEKLLFFDNFNNVSKADGIVVLSCIRILRQAEKEGKVYIDPPTESELAHLIFRTMNKDNISGMCSILAKTISDRLRRGE